MTESTTSSGIIFPVRVYLREMYPPIPRFILAAVWFYALYMGLAAFHGIQIPLLGKNILIGSITYFLFLLFLRLSDEWKDRQADLKYFPERSVPSGQVDLSIIKGMWVVTLFLLILIQFASQGMTLGFLVLMVYGLLMFRFFFMPKLISSKLLLALITHNPVIFLMHVYGVWTFSMANGVDPWNPMHFGLAFALYLPSFIWEVARKIRAPEKETAYQTYSQIFGPKAAASILVIGSLVFLFIWFIIAPIIRMGWLGLVGISLATLWFCYKSVVFILKPTPDHSHLKEPAENFSLVALVFICLGFGINHGELWTWITY